ncbi:MAG: hypothetical protein KatS3mg019_2101 [Fimbriimonadales bacterium]|nr:MAG: hypothetical protein KatS3mg019_1171 [Fimbriimonadales bacterium]GIV10010.1 MAG: hypothetical protein KatS3mg019_2101 [Fimbriimonadales bacterium]
MWNNPLVRSNRGRRALYQGAWAFALTLLILSVLGVVQARQAMHDALRQQAATLENLARVNDSLLRMERALLGLAHADSIKARFVGYDPISLHRSLQDAHRQAETAIKRVLEQDADAIPSTIQPTLIRLEMEWTQIHARLAEYIASVNPNRLRLMSLRAFSFRGQDTLGDALRDFQTEYLRWVAATLESETRALVSYSAAGGSSLLVMLVLAWLRWGLPARWIRRALEQPAHTASYEHPLQDTEWAELYQTVRFQAQRLREVEVFMRDAAMGRTPQPLKPTDPADSLARSSEWLLKRFEQLQSEQRKAV